MKNILIKKWFSRQVTCVYKVQSFTSKSICSTMSGAPLGLFLALCAAFVLDLPIECAMVPGIFSEGDLLHTWELSWSKKVFPMHLIEVPIINTVLCLQVTDDQPGGGETPVIRVSLYMYKYFYLDNHKNILYKQAISPIHFNKNFVVKAV